MSESQQRYLTTPIYYANGEPHIGHAYTTFLADTLARYHRQTGKRVLFLTGTDEHGQKIQEEAAARGVSPQELCDAMADRFVEAWRELGIAYDRFIRTTEPEHKAVVRAFLTRLRERDLIYEAIYKGWYCVPEERYWTEKDLSPDRNCPSCGRPLREIEEKNYFFRMSRFREDLIAHINANPGWILPESRRNEILGFLQNPLDDLSISRPRSRVHWGIPLPFDEDHVVYVWVDALINYLTASGAIDPSQPVGEQGFEDSSASWWPADLHVIGKDILTTHAVYWPSLLMAAGLPLPKRILAHGWWIVGKDKMSKSLGNVVDPLELRDAFGADPLRWYLLREMPLGSDASYTQERFLARYDELANVLGNLASRSVSMVIRYRDGLVPQSESAPLAPSIEVAVESFRAAMEALRPHEAFGIAMDLARKVNGFVEESAPWTLAKDPARAADLDEVLAALIHALALLSALFFPVMPTKMEALARMLGLPSVPNIEEAIGILPENLRVEASVPLFPRPERQS